MQEIELNFHYLSAHKYAKQTGIGYQTILAWCRSNKLEARKTDGGQWQVRVYKHDAVSKEEYESLLKRNYELEQKFESFKKLLLI